MIKNQRQYRTSRSQRALLSLAMAQARAVADPDVFVRAHIGALETDIARLEDEMRQYDLSRRAPVDVAALRHVGDLGRDLIRARIARNLTHKDLAQAVGKKEQAIQRLEAADYRTASLATLAAIASAIANFQG